MAWATMVVALMEIAKKEAAKAVPKFKASEAFIEEVQEAVLDLFLKGFGDCKKKVA